MQNILTLNGLRLDLDGLRKHTKTPEKLVLTAPPIKKRKGQINYNQLAIQEPLFFGGKKPHKEPEPEPFEASPDYFYIQFLKQQKLAGLI